MAEAVRGGRFVDPCRPRGTANCLLNQARIQMVAGPVPQLFLIEASHRLQLLSQPLSSSLGKHGAPIIAAFAIAHGQLTPA